MTNKLTSTPTIIAAVCGMYLGGAVLTGSLWAGASYLAGQPEQKIARNAVCGTVGMFWVGSLLSGYFYFKLRKEEQ